MRFHKKRICIFIASIISFFYCLDHMVISTRRRSVAELELEYKDSDWKTRNHYGKMWSEIVQPNKVKSQSYQDMEKELIHLNAVKVDQSNHELIRIIKKFWVFKPSLKNYSLVNNDLSDFSMGQSEIVDALLHKKERGFFVECGALDGETRSNSLFFERDRYWEGLLIEASLPNFEELMTKHRKSFAVPACLGIHTYPETMKFNEAKNRGRLIDGDFAYNWILNQGLEQSITTIQCFPLYSILLALGRTHIDYLSLDVEGLELDILQTIPWDRIDISILTVEFVHDKLGKETLLSYVQSKGYKLVTELSAAHNWANDFVFIKKTLIT